jgi:hypothetical protein
LCSEAVILIGLCLIIGNVEYGSKDPVFGWIEKTEYDDWCSIHFDRFMLEYHFKHYW